MRRHVRFEHPLLSEQERKACEMLFNGFERWEIEEELDISRVHLAQLFARARKKGVAVPYGSTAPRSGVSAPRCTLERLRELHETLGSMSLVGERLGITRSAVWRRLNAA